MTDREMENRSFQKRRIITHGDDVAGINTHTHTRQSGPLVFDRLVRRFLFGTIDL